MELDELLEKYESGKVKLIPKPNRGKNHKNYDSLNHAHHHQRLHQDYHLEPYDEYYTSGSHKHHVAGLTECWDQHASASTYRY